MGHRHRSNAEISISIVTSMIVALTIMIGCGGGGGGSSSGASNQDLLAPGNLRGEGVSGTRIQLKWSDESSGEIGFRVERSQDDKSFFPVGDVPANTTSFLDAGLIPETEYSYRIRSFSKSLFSPYSNIASMFTREASWSRTFGGGSEDLATDIEARKSSGFFAVGSTHSFGAGGSDAWVMRLDDDGLVLWERAYGGDLDDTGEAVTTLDDGGCVVVGSTQSFGVLDKGLWILRLDASGDIVWEIAYGGSNIDEGHDVVSRSDGTFFVVGSTRSFGAGIADGLWLHLGEDGSLIASKVYGTDGNEFFSSIEVTQDGGFAVAAANRPLFGFGVRSWVLSCTEQGVLKWDASHSGSGNAGLGDLVALGDGTITAAGSTYSIHGTVDELWVIQWDENGQERWQNTYALGNPNSMGASAGSIVAVDDNSLLIGATAFDAGQGDIWLFQLSTQGVPKLGKKYADTSNGVERVLSLNTASNQGISVAGVRPRSGTSEAWALNPDSALGVDFNASSGIVVNDALPISVQTGFLGSSINPIVEVAKVTSLATSAVITTTNAIKEQQAP